MADKPATGSVSAELDIVAPKTTETSVASTNRWKVPADRLRATTRWVLAVFGVIGTAFLGSLPFVGLGELEWPSARGFFALSGALLLLGGLTLVLRAASEVFVARVGTLTDFTNDWRKGSATPGQARLQALSAAPRGGGLTELRPWPPQGEGDQGPPEAEDEQTAQKAPPTARASRNPWTRFRERRARPHSGTWRSSAWLRLADEPEEHKQLGLSLGRYEIFQGMADGPWHLAATWHAARMTRWRTASAAVGHDEKSAQAQLANLAKERFDEIDAASDYVVALAAYRELVAVYRWAQNWIFGGAAMVAFGAFMFFAAVQKEEAPAAAAGSVESLSATLGAANNVLRVHAAQPAAITLEQAPSPTASPATPDPPPTPPPCDDECETATPCDDECETATPCDECRSTTSEPGQPCDDACNTSPPTTTSPRCCQPECPSGTGTPTVTPAEPTSASEDSDSSTGPCPTSAPFAGASAEGEAPIASTSPGEVLTWAASIASVLAAGYGVAWAHTHQRSQLRRQPLFDHVLRSYR